MLPWRVAGLAEWLNGTVPCFTTIRDPMERLVSLFYYIKTRDRVNVTTALQDMAPEDAVAELSEMWPLMRQMPLLTQFGKLGGAPQFVNGRWRPQRQARDDAQQRAAALETAATNLGRCVVGDVDRDDDTNLLLRFFFPWMKPQALSNVKLNTRSSRVPSSSSAASKQSSLLPPAERMFAPLPLAIREAFERAYAEEVQLYHIARRIHQAQVAYAKHNIGKKLPAQLLHSHT